MFEKIKYKGKKISSLYDVFRNASIENINKIFASSVAYIDDKELRGFINRKIKFDNIKFTRKIINVKKIYYSFSTHLTSIYEGYLDIDTNNIYDSNDIIVGFINKSSITKYLKIR